ncbi:MAG: epoxyqueuosine reductase QueH [Clostridiales bacterium]|nr:epoxyqueuosine reductase QueH [Clostridiales bacterium]
MDKINYQKEFEKMLEEIKKSDEKPELLLHSCCAPCSSYVIECLNNYFKLTVYYCNPNVFPQLEYEKRKEEQQRFIRTLNNSGSEIGFIEESYDYKDFEDISKGLEGELEGGDRCTKCYRLRLEKTAIKAVELSFDYFCTTLSVSPYKNAQKLNTIGEEFGEKYNIKYLLSDFKKKDGYKKSIELSKKYNFYRQDYCGCQTSLIQSQDRHNMA